MKKKTVFLILLILMSINVLCAPVYEYRKTTPVTDTVTLTRVEEFHFDHNMSYSYITVDLTDENISLTLLKSDKGTDVLDTLSELAKSDDRTVAAINGDFFSAYKTGIGFSLGIEYKDGNLLQSPIYPETMATTVYDGNSIYFDYIDFEISLTSPDGVKENVRHLNKHTDYYGDILMYTSSFNGGYSPAPEGVLEVVVEDNKIVEFRRNMESVKIPENGCVFAVSEGSKMYFANNFEVGDEILIEYKSSVDFENVKTSFGGGSMLVYEGQDVGKIGDYAHTVAGLHPRTALGVDKSGKKLILLTVDGRQSTSRGMRMSHLAELLIDLGCYNAVNLDGGGSTRMLASGIWSDSLEVANNPTENRKVIGGVGIIFDRNGFDDEETADEDREQTTDEELFDDNDGVDNVQDNDEEISEEIIVDSSVKPYGIKLRSETDTIFRGESVKIQLAVFDKHMQNAEYDKEGIEWSSDKGRVVDGTFFGDCSGSVTVSATLGDLYGDTEIYVVDGIDGIETADKVVLNVGDEYTPKVSVFDYNGKNLDVSDLSYFDIVSSDTDVVEVRDGTLVAKRDGTALVCISKNNAKSFISVAVGTKKVDFYDSFEDQSGTSSVYHEDVKGEFSYSDDMSLDGAFSGKFTYDFTLEMPETPDVLSDEDGEEIISVAETQMPDDISKAVYYVLSQETALDNSCDEIRLSVFAEDDFSHKMRVQLEDGKGKMKLIDFDGEIKTGEWSQLCAKIGKSIPRPVKVKKVYLLYSPGEEQDTGSIYVDGLSFTSFTPFSLPQKNENVYRNNLCNANVSHTFRIGAESDFDEMSPLSVYSHSSIDMKVKRADNFFVLSESSDYGIFEDDYAFYISLDTSKGGIRNTDAEQWKNIVNIVSSTDKKNLFLLCNNELFSEDEFENRVIEDYFASLDKNVFVISRSDYSSYKNVGGVGYFTVDKTPQDSLSITNKSKQNCIEFRFGDDVTFEFVSV